MKGLTSIQIFNYFKEIKDQYKGHAIPRTIFEEHCNKKNVPLKGYYISSYKKNGILMFNKDNKGNEFVFINEITLGTVDKAVSEARRKQNISKKKSTGSIESAIELLKNSGYLVLKKEPGLKVEISKTIVKSEKYEF